MDRVLVQSADENETSCRYGPDLERYFRADPELPILDQSENTTIKRGYAGKPVAMPGHIPTISKMRLYNRRAERLYLNTVELDRFIAAANDAAPPIRRFALTLAYTGCRLSEARLLRVGALQLEVRVLSVRCLKKRQEHVVREIPIPLPLLDALSACMNGDENAFLFDNFGRPVPRITAYRWIKRLMAEADLSGPRACPRGLRHSFGTRAILAGVPLHVLQAWMGHASMKTTAIYASVLGPEQQRLSDQMWSG